MVVFVFDVVLSSPPRGGESPLPVFLKEKPMKRSLTIADVFTFLFERWCNNVDSPDDFDYLAVNELTDCVSRRGCDYYELRDAIPHWELTLKAADPAFCHSLRLLINVAEHKELMERGEEY